MRPGRGFLGHAVGLLGGIHRGHGGGQLGAQRFQAAMARQGAGPLVDDGAPDAHLARGPHDRSVGGDEAQAEPVGAVGRQGHIQRRAHDHIAQKRLHGCSGVGRVGKLVDERHPGAGLGAGPPPRPGPGPLVGVVAQQEGHLALHLGALQKGRHLAYHACVLHEQRGHVGAEQRLHQGLVALAGADDVGERGKHAGKLTFVLGQPGAGLASI